MKKLYIIVILIIALTATQSMASKKRNGLSKREFAAAQQAKIKSTTKKSTSRISSAKSSYGSDPSLESEMGYIASPQYQQELNANKGKPTSNADFAKKNDSYNKKKKSSSKGAFKALEDSVSSSRAKAALAQNSLSGKSFKEASADVNRPTPSIIPDNGNNSSYLQNALLQEAKGLWNRSSGGWSSLKNLAEDIYTGFNNEGGLFGTPKAYAAEGTGIPEDLETGSLTDEQLQIINNERAFSDQDRISQIINDTGGTIVEGDSRAHGGGGINRNAPFNISGNQNIGLSDNSNRSRSKPSPTSSNQGISGIFGIDETPTISQVPSVQTVLGETTDNTPVQPDLGGTARKLFSSGAFGNGGGISSGGNISGLDPETQAYIKQMRKSASGDFGMKDAKRQIENLLNGIEQQYAESQRVGTNELNTAKVEDLNKLMSLFGAYNTADSEQRMQTQERTQSDYQTKLAELLAKLAAAKNADITSTKNKGLDLFSQIKQQKQSAQDKVAQLIYQAQQDAANRAAKYRSGSSSKNQSAIQSLLSKASNMPSGGREFAQQQAGMMGLGDISGYTPNGWEQAYNPNFGKQGYAPSGQVQQIMNELGVDEKTAQELIIQEMNNAY